MSDPHTLLPPSATALSRSIEIVMAERTQGIEAPIGTLWHVDSCPEGLLPWLAWSFSVETWDHRWPSEVKRRTIRNAIKVHRLKGTRRSVELALEPLGFDVDIVEGWQAGGAPHTFRIDAYAQDVLAAGYAIGPDTYHEVSRLIAQVKPVRSHFTLRIGETFPATVRLRAGTLILRQQDVAIDPHARPFDIRATGYQRSLTTPVRTQEIALRPVARPVVRSAVVAVRSLTQSTARSRLHHDPLRRGAPGDVARGAVARANLEAGLKRVEQLGAFVWSALPPGVPGARADYPKMIQPGDQRTGPPYSSVRLTGMTVGQDVSVETFLSAVANPDSVLYGIDLFRIAPAGRAFYGAVCSNFLAECFGWVYSPTTAILSRDWAQWGFRAEVDPFQFDDIEVGDVVVTKGGGHIELCVARSGATVTMFDQTYDGPDRRVWRKREFMAYAFGRGYKLLKYDWASASIHYRSNRFAPIRDEVARVPPPNPHVLLNRGNKSNYWPGEAVRLNVLAPARRLMIRRNGVPVDDIALSGPRIVSRRYDRTGLYQAQVELLGGALSRVEEFMVSAVTASASAAAIRAGAPVTVRFGKQNATPTNLIVENARNASISAGVLRELTADEIAAGEVTFTHDRPGAWNIQIRAENAFGATFSGLGGRLPLTVLAP